MSNDTQTLSTLDSLALASAHGGQQTTAGGRIRTPAGIEAEGNYSSTGTPERRNDFLTCMNDRQANCGLFQSPQSCQAMAQSACSGLTGSPQNPQISTPTAP